MAVRVIVWDKPALLQFKNAIRYIFKKSVQNSEKVMNEILEKIDGLSAHPEKFPPDKYKKNNAGDYRAFELHRFRVSYFVGDNEIRITRIRNTKRKPRRY